LGLMLIGFALGRSPETSNAVLRALNFGKKVAERTAVHVEGKMHRGLGRVVERRLSDEHSADILGSSYRSIDRTYLKLRRCLEADHPCPGFNHGSLRDYREDVTDHAVNELGGHYEFLKNRPWDIQPEDEQLARVLLEDGHESIQMVGLKI